MVELILGGVRSGKTRHAMTLARASGLAVTYLATATPDDGEMAQRIAAHRAERPPHWGLREVPLALAAAMLKESRRETCVVVDCLTLWMSNLMATTTARREREERAFLEALSGLESRVILVSNEVGLGVVPANALARRYADALGRLNQAVAVRSNRITMMVAGIPWQLAPKAQTG